MVRIHRWTLGVVMVVAVGSAAAVDEAKTRGVEVRENVIVPCLLPARVRKLGGMVYPERVV